LARGPLDVQIILDASGSVGKENWKKLLNEMKENFIDGLMSHKESRMAIARFGTTHDVITHLKKGVTGSVLNAYDKFENLGYTYLSDALKDLLPEFKKRTANSTATKFLFVFTDGKAHNPDAVEVEAKKWKSAVDHVYAMGYAGIDEEGLKRITDVPANVKFRKELSDLFKDVNEQVIPAVCDNTGAK